MNRKWQQVSPIERLGRWMVPQATMNRRGDIKLSRVAWEMLERPPYVFVLYEPSTRTIGLRPCNSHIKDTFTLKPDGLYGAQLLNVACLRVDLKVVTEHTIRFQDVRLDEEGTLILELAKATHAYHGRRVGAWHTERKTRLERQRQPHPHWLSATQTERDAGQNQERLVSLVGDQISIA